MRLFPRFADADHGGWGTVVRRAGDGNAAALEAVGFSGDAKTHPVCKAILDFVGAGKKGSEIRSHFMAAHLRLVEGRDRRGAPDAARR